MFSKILTKWEDVKYKRVILSLSGGLDSSTLYYNLVNKNLTLNIIPVFFDYNQKHLKQELKSAKKILNWVQKNTGAMPYELKIIKLNLNFLQNSSLINKELIINSDKDSLPNSFVAGRNILFLTYLASLGYDDNNKNIIIALANHKDDFNGYPDCRMNTLKSLQKTLSFGLDKSVKIFAPFTNLSKTDIVDCSNDYILKHSWSCYEGDKLPCNRCKSCDLRNKAIMESKNLKLNK